MWQYAPEEEIACVSESWDIGVGADEGDRFDPACWLWDYRRCSPTQGYLLSLNGGIDSCATGLIAYSMCRLAVDAARTGSTGN